MWWNWEAHNILWTVRNRRGKTDLNKSGRTGTEMSDWKLWSQGGRGAVGQRGSTAGGQWER